MSALSTDRSWTQPDRYRPSFASAHRSSAPWFRGRIGVSLGAFLVMPTSFFACVTGAIADFLCSKRSIAVRGGHNQTQLCTTQAKPKAKGFIGQPRLRIEKFPFGLALERKKYSLTYKSDAAQSRTAHALGKLMALTLNQGRKVPTSWSVRPIPQLANCLFTDSPADGIVRQCGCSWFCGRSLCQ